MTHKGDIMGGQFSAHVIIHGMKFFIALIAMDMAKFHKSTV